MIGAIAGDIIGSVYEHRPIKTKDFPFLNPKCRFTDDSVLTIAVALAILEQRPYQETIRELGRRYPDAGHGGTFIAWLFSERPRPYNSWGNGSAMRVSPIAFALDTETQVLDEARHSAEITHNHPEGIKGAQAVARVILMARQGQNKESIRADLTERFRYNLNRALDAVRTNYRFDISSQGTFQKRSLLFSTPTHTTMRSETQFLWAGTAILLPCLHHWRHRRGLLWWHSIGDRGVYTWQADSRLKGCA